eukprot:scaffold200562_cov34-Tisochrysis_lutea.AAC.4
MVTGSVTASVDRLGGLLLQHDGSILKTGGRCDEEALSVESFVGQSGALLVESGRGVPPSFWRARCTGACSGGRPRRRGGDWIEMGGWEAQSLKRSLLSEVSEAQCGKAQCLEDGSHTPICEATSSGPRSLSCFASVGAGGGLHGTWPHPGHALGSKGLRICECDMCLPSLYHRLGFKFCDL